MRTYMTCMEEKITDFYKRHGKYILLDLLGGVLTYFMMMSLNLVNDLDGIWHLSNFIAGDWEISLGRGLQRYADRARFGIVSDSFNTILTLLLIVTANELIIEKFRWERSAFLGLLRLLLVANPVVCDSLSYSYMSVNFGLAYFFSVLAFVCLKETEGKGCICRFAMGGVWLAVSLAFYQAYISVTCVLLVSYMLKLLLDGKSLKSIFRYLLTGACTVAVGGVLYLLLTKALLYRAGVQMASYRGASNINIASMLANLPSALRQCYEEFIKYFVTYKAMSDLEFIEVVLVALFLVYLAAVVLRLRELFRRHAANAIVFAVLVIILPVASCFVVVLAVGSAMSVLMSMGLVMYVVMSGVVVPEQGRAAFWVKRAYLLVLAGFVWFQLSAVVNDQVALKEGKTATVTLAQNIVASLYEGHYLEEYGTVALVGRPANNDTFAQSTAYHMANSYARFGCWSADARNNRVSWQGVLSNFVGVNVPLCGEEDYQELTATEEVASMPEFPAEGSVRVINGIVVVKVSELY